MEVLNDLLGYDLKIYQNNDYFCFSIDSVILANFCNIRLKCQNILDLGCGNGAVSLILSTRTKAHIDAVEIQSDLSNMANKSIIYNKKEKNISIYNCDIKDYAIKARYDMYDMIVSNPPYFKNSDKSQKNLDIHKIIARHEVAIKLDEIIEISFKLLKQNGILAMVNRVDRFIEILELLCKNHFEPKYIRFVYDNIKTEPSLFYIESIKCGKAGLKIDKPFIMYDINKCETVEYQELKGGKNDFAKR